MPLLPNVLLTTARAAYSSVTGQTAQAGVYLSKIQAAMDEITIESAQKFLMDANGGILRADYQVSVDAGTDIAVGDLITTIVLLRDGVTAWPADQTTTAIATTGSAIGATGVQTCTPASMTAISVGTPLLCDSGASQEMVRVSAVTSTTFTASFGHTHAANFSLALLNTLWRVVFHREAAPGILPERTLFIERIFSGGPISH